MEHDSRTQHQEALCLMYQDTLRNFFASYNFVLSFSSWNAAVSAYPQKPHGSRGSSSKGYKFSLSRINYRSKLLEWACRWMMRWPTCKVHTDFMTGSLEGDGSCRLQRDSWTLSGFRFHSWWTVYTYIWPRLRKHFAVTSGFASQYLHSTGTIKKHSGLRTHEYNIYYM
jgi:hypothetical protein